MAAGEYDLRIDGYQKVTLIAIIAEAIGDGNTPAHDLLDMLKALEPDTMNDLTR